MDTTRHDSTALPQPQASGFEPMPRGGVPENRSDREVQGATMTLVIALYPLVGSVTVVIAALLLAGGALAG